MFSPKNVNPNYVLVKINTKEQKEKRTKIGSIHLHPGQLHMGYNLQMGEVVSIGKNIYNILPEIKIGDTAIFSHVIEGTANPTDITKGETNRWLLYDDISEGFRYYIVRGLHYAKDFDADSNEYGEAKAHAGFLYGCMKKSGEVYMTDFYSFAIASPEEQDNRAMKKITLKDKDGKDVHILVFNDYKEERKEIEQRLEKLKMEAETHKQRAPILEKEMEQLTKSLNKKRAATFVPVFVPKSFISQLGVDVLDMTWIFYYQVIGMAGTLPQVTQITIMDKTFYVLRNDFVLLAKKMNDETINKFFGAKNAETV